MARPLVTWTQDEIISRVEMIPFCGCWIWMCGRSKNGYGAAWTGSKLEKAHRLSYELFCGPIAEGMFILHKCDVKECVNPAHLYMGSAKQNTVDALARGRLPMPFRTMPGLASRASKSVSSEAKSRAGKLSAKVRWG